MQGWDILFRNVANAFEVGNAAFGCFSKVFSFRVAFNGNLLRSLLCLVFIAFVSAVAAHIIAPRGPLSAWVCASGLWVQRGL